MRGGEVRPEGGAAAPVADTLEARQDLLLACVHCGFCLPACPTYTRLGDEADSPRGRLLLMRARVEGRLEPDSEAFQTHLDRCLGCRACETVCPSGVEYGALLESARAEATAARPLPFLTRAILRVFASATLTRVVLGVARLLRASGLPTLTVRYLPPRGKLGLVRVSMAMLAATRPWRPGDGRVERRPGSGATPSTAGALLASDSPAPRTGILEGCVQRGLFGGVNAATERVLEANGFPVCSVPGQGCCGALHAHAGDLATARVLARRNVDAFEAAGVQHVAVNAAGCGAAMKAYGHLLEGDVEYAERARRFSERVRDISESLAERGPISGAALPVSATYDAPCHLLHAQRVSAAPRSVLGAIPALDFVPLDGEEECCGGAGIYALTHPELGGRIGRDKVAAVRRSGAEVLVSGNPGCLMQIGAWLLMEGSETRTAHLVELLDESYRRAGLYASRGPR